MLADQPLRILEDDFIGIDFSSSMVDFLKCLFRWIVLLVLIYCLMQFTPLGGWSTQHSSFSLVEILSSGVFCAFIHAGWRIWQVRFRSYKLDCEALHVKQGVLTRRHRIVPRNRIQHTSISRSFLQRKLGFATFTVYTAGSQMNSVAVENLRDSEGEKLQSILIIQSNRD